MTANTNIMEVDVTGTSAVASLIEQSGYSKFSIQRPGAHRNNLPVFEFLRGSNVKQAVEAFKAWANNVLSGGSNMNSYEIVLFDDLNDDNSEEEVSHSRKKKSRSLRFTFGLSNTFGALPVINGASPAQSTDDAIKQAVALALAERDKLDLLREVKDLRSRVEELENIDDDDDDDEVGSPIDQLGALLSAINGKTAQAPAINGTETKNFTKEQAQNINRALSVLHRFDDQIDTDLLKLAAIAQSNPTQFNFLLNALRNM